MGKIALIICTAKASARGDRDQRCKWLCISGMGAWIECISPTQQLSMKRLCEWEAVHSNAH